MDEKKGENIGVTNSFITNVHCFKENFPSSFQQKKHCVAFCVSQFLQNLISKMRFPSYIWYISITLTGVYKQMQAKNIFLIWQSSDLNFAQRKS